MKQEKMKKITEGIANASKLFIDEARKCPESEVAIIVIGVSDKDLFHKQSIEQDILFKGDISPLSAISALEKLLKYFYSFERHNEQ